MTDGSFFKQAREAARYCTDKTRRDLLRGRTDFCQECYDLFKVEPSRGNMETLVAAWTRMVLAFDALPPLADNPSRSGRQPVPKAA